MWNIREKFPTLVSLLPQEAFEKDLGRAWHIYCCLGIAGLNDACEEQAFCLSRAFFHILSDLVDDWPSKEAAPMEQDLQKLKKEFGHTLLDRTFKEKLQSNGQFLNTMYEVAAGSILSRVVDEGTLRPEVPIPDSKKDTDYMAEYEECPFRTEVTVIKEQWPPSEDEQAANGEGSKGGAYTRATISRHEKDDLFDEDSNRVSVDFASKQPGRHKITPFNEILAQKLGGKLSQCADDVCNIILIACHHKPNPEFDFISALRGTVYACDGQLASTGTGPFVPDSSSKDPQQFVDRFRKVSAVWSFRLFKRGQGESICYPNPNASNPIPETLKDKLEGVGEQRVSKWK